VFSKKSAAPQRFVAQGRTSFPFCSTTGASELYHLTEAQRNGGGFNYQKTFSHGLGRIREDEPKKVVSADTGALRLLPWEINERTAGGLQWTCTRITDRKFFAPVCRRKIIFLHLLPSVATTFPKPLQNIECKVMNGGARGAVTGEEVGVRGR